VDDRPRPPLSRREALRLAAAAPVALLVACRRAAELPPGTVVSLAELPEGRRVRVLRGEEPVELVRTGTTVRARSLWCTHLGCEVSWNEASASYDCPCHDGRYDADGRVLGGPPTAALRAVATQRVGDRLVLLEARPTAGAPSGG
jgi:Rieske Fe-S protein